MAEASDSQAWASRVSVSMSGLMVNIEAGLWGAAMMFAARSVSGGLGVDLIIDRTPVL
ncbi:hypothetical protein D3C80_1695170 [compost metagenome]